jgi:hypothetical protein
MSLQKLMDAKVTTEPVSGSGDCWYFNKFPCRESLEIIESIE